MIASSPQACMSEFAAAMIRQDMAAALPLLTDDVVFFYSNGTVIVGKDAFASSMTSNWKLIENYKYATLDSTWLTQSDADAVVLYSFAWSGSVRGAEVSGGGRGTRVFRKDGRNGLFRGRDAGWRIAHEHLSIGEWRAPSG